MPRLGHNPAGEAIATLSGATVTVLCVERTCLILAHLSAIATFTRRCVEALARARSLLTRARPPRLAARTSCTRWRLATTGTIWATA